MIRNNIAIVTSGYFPVPATRGGAVEALVENLINVNETSGKAKLYIFSVFDRQAEEIAKKYSNTNVVFVKTPSIIKLFDKMIFFIAKNVLRKEKSFSYRYICQRLWFIHEVGKNLKDNNYDRVVLENHSSLFMTLRLHKNYEKYSGKYFYHLHNVVTSSYGCEKIIRKTKSVLGVSDYINQTLKEFLGETSIEYKVLRNKIDSNRFRIELNVQQSNEIREKYDIKAGQQIVLFTGRFSPEKGIRELLTAFKKVKSKNAILLVVGGYYFGSGMISSFEIEMKELVEKLAEKIKFAGFIDYKKIPEFYAIADIVVIPSVWDDPAPLTVIESLSAGKALITTYSGGIPEYANKNVAIMLKKEELETMLAPMIDELLMNKRKREQMSKRALELTKNWNIEAYYTDFMNAVID